MSTLQNTIHTRPTRHTRRVLALAAAAALTAILTTVLIITLTATSPTATPPTQRASAPAPQTSQITQPHAVINPEIGLMHGG